MNNVILTTQCYPPDMGGIETYMGDLVYYLRSQGINVFGLADRAKIRVTNVNEDPLIKRFGGPRPIRRLIKAFYLKRLISGNPNMILLADTWKSLEAINLPFTPKIVFAHGNELLLTRGTAKFLRAKKALHKADYILANSNYTANLVTAFDVPPENIIVFNIPTAPQIDPSMSALREIDAIISEFDKILVTVARIEPRKGIDSVISIMPRILAVYPDIGYIIIGDGPYKAELQTRVKALGIGKSVRFLGQVSSEIKAAILSRAYAFVMPTRLAYKSVEGFGISYMEAAWYGVPSIASDSGGATDAVLDHETGLICRSDNQDDLFHAVLRLLSTPDLRQELSEKALIRAHNDLSWDRKTEQLVKLMLSAVQKRHQNLAA